jgi:hypothetical protein
MALLFMGDGQVPTEWETALRAEIPDLDFRVWPDGAGDPHEIDIVLTWQPPRRLIATFPNLKAILSLAAGIEHILRDPELPPGVPIARLIDPGLHTGMVEFIAIITGANANTAPSKMRGTGHCCARPCRATAASGFSALAISGRPAERC